MIVMNVASDHDRERLSFTHPPTNQPTKVPFFFLRRHFEEETLFLFFGTERDLH